MRALGTVGRLLRAATAFVVLAGFLGGVPWLLNASAGWPLSWLGWPHLTQPPGLGDVVSAVTSPWSDPMILGVLASIGWVLWLIFLRHVIVEIIEASAAATAARHGRTRVPVAGRGPIRWVAAVLVGAIVGAVLFDAARAATGIGSTSTAADAAARRPAVTVAAARTAASTPAAHSGPRPAITVHHDAATALPHRTLTHQGRDEVPAWAADAPGGVHHVVHGDNLWDIAKDKLGNPYRWREIYTLNRGHQQADGYALTDPDEIHTGWVLAMPATHHTAAHPHTSTNAEGGGPTSPPAGATQARPEDTHPAPSTSATTPSPATSTPTASMPPATDASPQAASPTAGAAATTSTSAPTAPTQHEPTTAAPGHSDQARDDHARPGISLPSQGWVSLGLAALITAVAAMLRLQRRRHARLGFPVPTRIAAQPTPVPEPLAVIDALGGRLSAAENDPPTTSAATVAAPVGLDAAGHEASLFDLPGPGIALTGEGAEPAARAVLAAVLATDATDSTALRPVVVTTAALLSRLLPDGAPLVGLDPDGTSFDGEHLIVLDDPAAAVMHAEEEMLVRRRLLDSFDLDSVTALNERTDHAEMQPPYVLLIEATTRHAARLLFVGAHRAALHLHQVILGPLDGFTRVEVTADGTTGGDAAEQVVRWSTLATDDLAAVLAMLTAAAPRPELGHDIDLDADIPPAPIPMPAGTEDAEPIPAQPCEASAPVRLRVLGPVMVETDAGPVETGMRSGSYLVLTLLAVHPSGRTLEQLAADLHPDTAPGTAGNRIRTDISTTRRVLRAATGLAEPMFIIYDGSTGRYRLDAELITVDLWRMLTAIEGANNAQDDSAALTALRQAAQLYGGDLAEDHEQAWITDHATTYRHHILSVYARIAELLETDHPDQAVTALEHATNLDPVNEELYQRIMRIHGRAGRTDQVRRTLQRLEQRLADLGVEPSDATRRVAERQLRPPTTSGGGRR